MDRFFDAKGVAKDVNAGAGSGVLANTGVDNDPRQGLIETMIGKVRAKNQEDLAARKPGASTGGAGKLKTFAKGVFQELINDFNRNNPNKAIFTPTQVAKAIEMVVKVGSFVATGKPPAAGALVFAPIRRRRGRSAIPSRPTRASSRASTRSGPT